MKMLDEQSMRTEIANTLKELLTNYGETERLSRIVDTNRYLLQGTLGSDSKDMLESLEDQLNQEIEIVHDSAGRSGEDVIALAEAVEKMQDTILMFHDGVDELVIEQVEAISTEILSSCSD